MGVCTTVTFSAGGTTGGSSAAAPTASGVHRGSASTGSRAGQPTLSNFASHLMMGTWIRLRLVTTDRSLLLHEAMRSLSVATLHVKPSRYWSVLWSRRSNPSSVATATPQLNRMWRLCGLLAEAVGQGASTASTLLKLPRSTECASLCRSRSVASVAERPPGNSHKIRKVEFGCTD